MKKLLLSAMFFAAVTASAQQISFEESEGYVAGEIVGQNGWDALGQGDVDVTLGNVDSNMPSAGTNNLSITSDASSWDYYAGFLSPQLDDQGAVTDVYFDFYPESDVDSDHVFWGLSTDQFYTAYFIRFNWQGAVGVLDGESTDVEAAGEYTAGSWYTVHVNINTTNGVLTYYVNDAQVWSGATFPDATTLDNLLFAYDNYGSGYSIDNINVTAPLSTGDNVRNAFTVYPNPAKDELNVSSAAGVKSVTINDINGRSVKTVQFDNVAQAKVNIAELQSGVYFANITSATGSKTVKVIKG